MNGMFSKCETLLVEILCIVMMLNWAYHYLRRSKLTLKIWNLCKQHGRTVGWVRQFTAGTRMLSCHSPITHAQMYRHKILENLAGPVDPYDRSRQLSPSRPISIQYSSQLTNQRPGNGESSGPRTVRCDDTEVSRRRSLTLVQLSCAQWVRLGTELFRSCELSVVLRRSVGHSTCFHIDLVVSLTLVWAQFSIDCVQPSVYRWKIFGVKKNILWWLKMKIFGKCRRVTARTVREVIFLAIVLSVCTS